MSPCADVERGPGSIWLMKKATLQTVGQHHATWGKNKKGERETKTCQEQCSERAHGNAVVVTSMTWAREYF